MEYIKIVVEPVSVLEAITEYLSHSQHLGARTLEEYCKELDRFATWCTAHHVMLHEVDNKVVYQFLDDVRTQYRSTLRFAREMSSSTVGGYVRVIKTFLNWCLHKHAQLKYHVAHETIEQLQKPMKVEPIVKPFSPEQIAALFAACEKEESAHLQMRDMAMLAVLFDTGIRASELVFLTLDNVWVDRRDAHIATLGKRTKWGENGLGARSQLLVNEYIDAFRMPILNQLLKDDPYHTKSEKRQYKKHLMRTMPAFVNRSGQQLTRSGLYKIMDRLGEWAEVEDVRCSPHTWRHTFATTFMRQGGDIYTLSKLLKHSSVDVTEIYLKSLDQSEARKHAKSVLDNMDL